METRLCRKRECTGHQSLRVFKELVQEGSQGLVITDANADDFSRDMEVDRRDITGLEEASTLEVLEERIGEFLSKERFGAILLNAIDGIIKKYGEVRALLFINAVIKRVSSADSILVISVNPKSVRKKFYEGLTSLSSAGVDELHY